MIVEVHGDPRTFTRALRVAARRRVSRRWPTRSPLRHPPRRRDARALAVHVVARRGGARAAGDRVLPHLQRPVGVPRSAARCRFPTSSGSSSSARSSSTRTSTGSPRPGGASRRALPDATLVVVGHGSRRQVIDRLVADLPGQVEHHPELPPERGRRSRSTRRVRSFCPRGPRVSVASCSRRSRAVGPWSATDARRHPATSSPTVVDGILIPPADTDALVAALRARARGPASSRCGSARPPATTYAPWHQTPEDFAHAYRELVDRVLAGAR